MSGKSSGWYPDPGNNLQERFWDGKEWVPFKVRPANTDLTFKDVHNARELGNADTVQPDKSPVENPSTRHKKVKYVLVGGGILLASVSLLLLVLPSFQISYGSTLFRASTTLRLILGNALLLAGIALLVTGRWRKMLHATNISNGAKRRIILLLIVALLFLRRM